MIRKIILIFFLMLPLVCAENYHDYKTLDMEMDVSADINIDYQQSNSRLEHLIVNFYFFPKENSKLKILKMERLSIPQATLTESKDGAIMFRWDDPEETKLYSEIKSRIRSKNDFIKIPVKIRFPVTGINRQLLKYTEETRYIDFNHNIATKASELAEGETDLHIVVYKIADWVKNNIEYDLNTLTEGVVQKSSWVLKNREGVCDEITNLFISMLRSLKIPARFVSGVVYSNVGNKFSNHGWAEVYFPDYGWVPFDITFGQYGWVDPTHVKLASVYDPSEPSIGYAWRSINTNVNVEPMDIKTRIIKGEKGITPLVSLEIEPLKEEANFKSYVPVKVTARNLVPYYIPLIVSIRKAPGLLENPVRHSVLKPLEQKSLYWIAYPKEELLDNYVYSYDLEARSLFGATASSKIKFSKRYDFYSKGWAEEKVKELSKEKEKQFLREIDFNCAPDHEEYYFNETARINCTLANKGNVNFNNINVCMEKDCRKVDLKIAEEASIDFETVVLKDMKLRVTAEIADFLKQIALDVDMVERPEIEINLKPLEAGYDEEVILELDLTSPSNAHDVEVNIKNLKRIQVNKLKTFKIRIETKGKRLMGGLKVEIDYKDKNGRSYSTEKKFKIRITNMPFYARVYSFIKNAFG